MDNLILIEGFMELFNNKVDKLLMICVNDEFYVFDFFLIKLVLNNNIEKKD